MCYYSCYIATRLLLWVFKYAFSFASYPVTGQVTYLLPAMPFLVLTASLGTTISVS